MKNTLPYALKLSTSKSFLPTCSFQIKNQRRFNKPSFLPNVSTEANAPVGLDANVGLNVNAISKANIVVPKIKIAPSKMLSCSKVLSKWTSI